MNLLPSFRQKAYIPTICFFLVQFLITSSDFFEITPLNNIILFSIIGIIFLCAGLFIFSQGLSGGCIFGGLFLISYASKSLFWHYHFQFDNLIKFLMLRRFK